MTAVLKITDGTAAGTVDLLGTDGYVLSAWRPAIAGYKGGGVFQSSSLSDGRRLVHKTFDNTVERFDLKAVKIDQDSVIRTTQELRRLLEKAAQYWTTDWQDEPVWIEAKATKETNTRYAIIHTGVIPEDENPFTQPFLQGCGSVMDNLTLIVERGHWLEDKPTENTCVEASGMQEDWGTVTNNATFTPSAATDDAHVSSGGNISTTTTYLYLGKVDNQPTHIYDTGIRFRNVTIPQGAHIGSAIVRLTAYANIANEGVRLRIYGEDEGTPAAFSTCSNFVSRERTFEKVDWDNLPDWFAGTAYDSPDIADVIQEIVDRGDWASGNDLVVFIEDDGSDDYGLRIAASWDHLTYNAPQLIIDYVGSPASYGREATCEREVYFANTHHIGGQLTHLYVDDGGVLGPNLLGSGTPYNLLPAVPVANDAVYFCSANTVTDYGPFQSLVFDIGTVAEDLGVNCVWQFWDSTAGPGWTTMTVQDNTKQEGNAGGHAFDTPGVGSVHWDIKTNWLAADPLVIGVTGYWVRFLVVAPLGGAPVGPTQQNRDVYTITWAGVNVAEDQVGGDIPALMEMVTRCQSTYDPGTTLTFYAKRLIAGLRSVDRGENFVAYINISDLQQPDGISVSVSYPAAFSTDTEAPTGRSWTYSPPLADAWRVGPMIELDNAISGDFYGIFYGFIRVEQVAGATGEAGVRIRIAPGYALGDSVLFASKEVYTTSLSQFHILDMGRIEIPGAMSKGTGIYNDLSIAIECINTNAVNNGNPLLTIYDLILIPADEFIVDTDIDAWPNATGYGKVHERHTGSISYPYRQISSLARRNTELLPDNNLISPLIIRANGESILQNNKQQKMWFFVPNGGAAGIGPISIAHTIQFFKAQRYLSMRGNR